jgi:DNA-binding response OmpR family regulator
LLNKKVDKKILIVDDVPENIELLEDYLSLENYIVITASSGKGALQKIKEEKPDMVLLDVMIPDMTGFEICKVIKNDSETRFTQILMLTTLSETEDRIKGIEAGADDFLIKPIR